MPDPYRATSTRLHDRSIGRKLVKEKAKLDKDLQKRGAYTPIGNLAPECSVKNDLSNLEEVAAEMLRRFEKEDPWGVQEGRPASVHNTHVDR